MTPLLLFLLACAAIYVGTVTAAFSALMRLSLRLMAERSDRDDLLGRYLDDPLRLFIPARMVLGDHLRRRRGAARAGDRDAAGHGLPTLIAVDGGVRAGLRAPHPAGPRSAATRSACSR